MQPGVGDLDCLLRSYGWSASHGCTSSAQSIDALHLGDFEQALSGRSMRLACASSAALQDGYVASFASCVNALKAPPLMSQLGMCSLQASMGLNDGPR